MGEVRAGDEVAGRYRLVRPLGSGGQGDVWEAVSLSVSTLRVAMKRVRHDGEGPAPAVREAEALARVRHPNVVPVHDLVEDDGDHWIVMAYVEGEPLGALRRVSVQDAARYGAQLADGLVAVHRQGLLHRDVTPTNVLVTDRTAVLIDFGIARDLARAVTVTGPSGEEEPADAPDDGDGSSSGPRVSGTRGYLAPELLVPGTEFRRPADVYALGATLYRALEGVPPQRDRSGGRAGDGPVRTPRQSGAVGPLLLRMLDPDPHRRPDMEDVRDELEAIADGGAAGAAAGTGTGPVPDARARRRSRVRALVVAACVLVLVAAGGGYTWHAYGPGAEGPPAAGADTGRGGRVAPPPSSPSPTPSPTPERSEPAASASPAQPVAGGAGTGTGGSDAGEDRAPADPEQGRPPLTFPAKTGAAAQEATWDPCALLRTGALRQLGDVRTDSDRDGFETCHATVASGSATSEVELTMYVDEDPDGSGSAQAGGVTLYSSDGGSECSREVVFGPGDRYNLSFEARPLEGSGPDLCDLAEAVAEPAAARAASGDLPVRTAAPLRGSVIGRNTCDLPSDDALRTALAVDDLVGPQREFAEWDCKWDGDDGRDLRLLFQRDEGYGHEGTKVSAPGHAVYERGDAWGEGCLVDVVAAEGASPEGDGPVTELLRVHLTGESDRDTLCEDAVAVARSAASSL